MTAARWGGVALVLLALFGWQHEAMVRHAWRHLTGQRPGPDAAAANVTLYVFDGCGDACDDAADFFHMEDIHHTVVNVDHDATGRAFVDQRGGGLPLIVDGRREYHGYDPYFLEQWYLQRRDTARQLQELGLFAAGVPHTALIFGTSWCRYCTLAAHFFESHGIPYRELDIESSPTASAQEHSLFGENPLPGIVYADMLYAGYSESELDAQRKWIGNE